MSLIRIPRLSK